MKAEYVDHMGTDLSVVNAARVSFNKLSGWVPSGSLNDYPGVVYQTDEWGCAVNLSQDDHRLIHYLARGCSKKEWMDNIEWLLDAGQDGDWNRIERIVEDLMHMATHWTPFTHTAITLRMKAPVPIRTQCFKHKQGFTENEESRRYIKSVPEVFTPNWRWAADNVKQGSGRELTQEEAHNLPGVHEYERVTTAAVNTYLNLIDDGICPEQARFVLPQGVEVNWIWTGNLASFARFYNQRTDSHAQLETQTLARAVGEIIEPLFPVSWKALTQ